MPVQQLGRCHVQLLSGLRSPVLQADHLLRAHHRHNLMLDDIAAGALSTVVKADWALLHATLLHADKLQLPALHTKQVQTPVSSKIFALVCEIRPKSTAPELEGDEFQSPLVVQAGA